MNLFQLLYRPAQRQSVTTHPAHSRARLCLESLETRLAPASVFVVPIIQTADNTHLYDLAAALSAAGAGGMVTTRGRMLPEPS